MRKIKHLLLPLWGALMVAACSSIDCPLNSRVMSTCKFGDNGEKVADTLTVSTTRADGNDSVLVNRVCDVDSIQLPMSYNHAEDVYIFDFLNKDKTHTIDHITIVKDNMPHFESVDCSPIMFHNITDVRYTTNKVEKVTINNSYVTYNDAQAHLIIYLKRAHQ